MKQPFAPSKARALAPLLAATALFATPAFAQDAQPAAAPPQTTVTPPPVVATQPDSAPAAQSSTATNPRGIGDPNSTTPIAPEALAAAKESQAARAAAAKRPAHVAARPAVTHHAVSTRAPAARPAEPAVAAPAPITAAPIETPVPAPVAATPPSVAPTTQPAPEAVAPDTTQQTTTATVRSTPVWPWVAGGVVILAGLLAMLLGARRRRATRYEDAYEPEHFAAPPIDEPVHEAAPVAKPAARREPKPKRFVPAAAEESAVIEDAVAAPAAPEDVTVGGAAEAEVASLTEGTAPVADRPWLELAMRPLRAGTNVDEALVEIELTVGNAGTVQADDVRISTFMLTADPGSASEMEKLLLAHREDAAVPVSSIGPGEGKRIDATLALLKSEFVTPEDARDASFQPMIVADARYRLPDGSEGRTSASFLVGLTLEGGEGLEPFSLARPEMHENVEARLTGEPQRA